MVDIFEFSFWFSVYTYAVYRVAYAVAERRIMAAARDALVVTVRNVAAELMAENEGPSK